MTRQTITYFILLIGFSSVGMLAQKSPESLWREGVRQYRKENYHKAKESFEALLQRGYNPAELYYNLGNTYARLQEYPTAMLMYERALKMDPGMTDARENLKELRDEIDTDIVEIKPFFLTDWWRHWLALLSPNLWAGVSLILFLLMAWLFRRYFDGGGASVEKQLITAGILAMLFIVSAYGSYRMRTNQSRAVVYPEMTGLHEGPDLRSPAETEVPAGLHLFILDSIGSWYKVALPDKQIGWMPDTSVVKL